MDTVSAFSFFQKAQKYHTLNGKGRWLFTSSVNLRESKYHATLPKTSRIGWPDQTQSLLVLRVSLTIAGLEPHTFPSMWNTDLNTDMVRNKDLTTQIVKSTWPETVVSTLAYCIFHLTTTKKGRRKQKLREENDAKVISVSTWVLVASSGPPAFHNPVKETSHSEM